MASSGLPWLDRLLAGLPALCVLAGWASSRGKLTTAAQSLLGFAVLASLLTLSRAPLLIGVWLLTSVVCVGLFRQRPAVGLRVAAASSALLIATLVVTGA